MTRLLQDTVMAGVLALALLPALSGCAKVPAMPAATPGDCHLVAVSSNGWHTSLYLPASAFPEDGPLRTTFADAQWFAVGWGDALAYVDGINPANAPAALLWPTPSVLHIAGLQRDPRAAYSSEYRNAALSGAGLEALAQALEAELALDGGGAPRRVAAGLDPRGSAFLAARSSYHAFQTCNVWTAAQLNGAGVQTGWTGGHLLPSSLLARIGRTALPACPDPSASP